MNHAAITLDELNCLTPREREILRLLGEGMAPAEIAKTPDCIRAVKTIYHHIEAIGDKLGIAGPHRCTLLALVGQRLLCDRTTAQTP